MKTSQSGALRRILVIASREFNATVRRREFVLVTLGLPLLYVFIGIIVGGTTASVARTSIEQESRRAPSIGYLDQSGLMDKATLEGRRGRNRVFTSEQQGQQAVRDKQVRAFVVIPPDFARKSSVVVYAPEKSGSILSGASSRGDNSAYIATLRRALLATKTDKQTADLVTSSVDVETRTADPKTGVFRAPDTLREIGKFAVPYAFSLLLLLSVIMGSSYLLHGIVEEKENRVIEVLLSAVTHEELLLGKILGLGAVSLTQLAIWVSGAVAVVGAIAARFPQASALVAGPGLIFTAVLLFLLGYAMNATLMAGFGAMGTSWRESSQISSIVVLPLVLPTMIMPVFLEQPNGAIARTLSLFPLTAPVSMMLRVAAGGASIGEVVLCAFLLLVTTVFFLRGAARLFRLSLLLYGQRPELRLVLRYLFSPRLT